MNFTEMKGDESAEHDTQPAWTFIRSQRGAPLIVHSEFVYRCERKIAQRTYWLCIRYKSHKCNGRLILHGNAINKATNHNHQIDERANDHQKNFEYKSLEDDDVDEWIKGNKIAPKE